MLVHSFFSVLKYLSIGALSYGYPALLMLWITWTDSQNPVKAFDVYWLPWSLCRIRQPFAGRWESNAFCRVRTARSPVMWLSAILPPRSGHGGLWWRNDTGHPYSSGTGRWNLCTIFDSTCPHGSPDLACFRIFYAASLVFLRRTIFFLNSGV